MNEKEPMPVIIASGQPFELLLATTLKGLKNSENYASQITHIVSKPELLELVKSFAPQDAIELLLILQFLIGYLWSTERLSRGHSFGDFSNLSLRAADLLIRYKAVKLKKASKKDIPHEAISED